jgi:hypothetical protein
MEGGFSPFLRFSRAERLIKANAVGRSSKTVREFLEKNHKEDMNRVDTIKLTVKSLLEVVQTGAKNIEITVMESFGKQTVRILWPSIAFVLLIPCGRASPCKKSRLLFQTLKGRKSRVSLLRVYGTYYRRSSFPQTQNGRGVDWQPQLAHKLPCRRGHRVSPDHRRSYRLYRLSHFVQ